MTKLNLIECCLLEASGELGPAARQRLYAYLDRHPMARTHLASARSGLALLQTLPHTELSAEHRRQVAESLKRGIRRKLDQRTREEAAQRRWKLAYRAVGFLSAAAAVVVIAAGIFLLHRASDQRQMMIELANSARAADRLSVLEDHPTQYDQAITDVESSINQMQSQGTVNGDTASDSMTNLFDALASVPPQSDDDAPETGAL